MTVYEARAKQATLDAVKALFDGGNLTWAELHRHMGARAPYPVSVAEHLDDHRRLEAAAVRRLGPGSKNNSSPAA